MDKKDRTGLIVMAIVILFSFIGGTTHSAEKLRDDTLDSYYYDKTGYSVTEGLNERSAACENLITVAEKYAEEYDDLANLIDDLEYNIDWLRTSLPDHSQQAEANAGMGAAAQRLYDRLLEEELSERDLRDVRGLIAQMDSAQDKIERSSYNDDARAFNEKLHSFPLSLVRAAGAVEELTVFDEEPSDKR